MKLARFKKYISLVLFLAILLSFLPKGNIAMAIVEGLGGAVSNLGTGGGGLLDMPATGVSASGLGLGSAAGQGIPVKDNGALLQRILKNIKDSWYQAMDLEQGRELTFKEYFLDPLAWTAANVIIDQFGDALVDWIRNGFEGSPMFLSDPEGFFRDTANQFSGAIIDALDMEWLCDPLGKLRLNIDFFFPGTDRAKYKCTFNDIADNFENIAGRDDLSDWINVNVNVHERNIVRAYGSDYRNGGFLMWLLTAQKKNNDLGRTLQTANDAYAAARINVGTEKFNLNLNSGFFGIKKCVEWKNADPNLPIDTSSKNCLKYETKTPGSLVQDQLNNSANKDLRRLQVADEIDEIIGALATTMMGWLLTGGNDGGGVLGYDKNADYSGSNRDHYGELDKNQKLIQKKTKTSGQITTIENHEELYGNSLKDYANILDSAKSDLETNLAKLKCIRATSTNDTLNVYPDSDCDGINEDIKNINLSSSGKTTDDINSDIGETENQITEVDGKIAGFNSRYGEDAANTSAQALELFGEFEKEIMTASDQSGIETIKNDYCYSYDKKDETGTICGTFGDGTVKTYQTHSNKEFEDLNKETIKITTEMDSLTLESACILNDYTQSEDVTKSECSVFESSSSASSQ